ncbi:tRNA 2-thiouridine synthesizing protein A [Roseibium hamelinense]|uniref:tRNA 2-thiouridine synthesizing protein A n=1 Tax=Roseibium hamelinense TaxID=150831 RepID=A0A562SL13_9HYPH|nr:sulfurtransferase TusA family protein [Roseibium hamelinense]MTI43411.1 sulfurtransferase TusA family protein [Roseibium hamelinense]TWI81868.1 tRNA 2-thiouridine synthesizing protein A [Roseibium hamelinense]
MSADHTLDVKGLKCPLPVLKTRKAMKSLVPGDTITILTTDPMAAIDIPHYCQEDGHVLISADMDDTNGTFVIRKC